MRIALIVLALAASQFSSVTHAKPTLSFSDELVARVPKLAMLKKHDPSAFQRIAKIYEEGLKSGRPQDESIGLARKAFMDTHAARVVLAPDKLILRAFDSTLSVVKDLQRRDVERCASLLSGGNAGDIKPLLSPATIMSEDSIYDAMLKYRAVAFTKAASADEEQAFVVKVLAAESAAAGEKPVAFVSRMYAAPDTYCALQLTILEHMRKEPNAVALFRRRMSGGQGE